MTTSWQARFLAIQRIPWGRRRERAWFDLYHEYLASPEWAVLRAQVVERDAGECRRHAGVRGDVVHHLTYRRIGAELLSDLMLLCTACHDWAHETKNRLKGRRRTG